jgi:Zn-finger nucleic acid-binding protein
MAPYTSDKGEEKWELLEGLDNFTDVKGPMSFARHGQAQLLVAEVLRAGGAVLAKRMVSDDATLANTTVRARIVVVDGVSYVYFYTRSGVNVVGFEEAVEIGYDNFTDESFELEDGTFDVPLFTVTPKGRGISNIKFRFNPEYLTSRSTSGYIAYTFEIYEGSTLLEGVTFTMNPNVILNGVSQAMNPKVNANSKQVKVRYYDDGFAAFVNKIAETASDSDGTLIGAESLINYDFINGYNVRGTVQIGNLVVKADATAEGTDLWSTYKPSDIDVVVDLSADTCIALGNGSFGTAGTSPVTNTAEYEKMLLGTFGADKSSLNYDDIIYDLDEYKIEAVFDCDFPLSVKKAITDLADFRDDMVFFADFGRKYNTYDSILDFAYNMPHSRNVHMSHVYGNVYDPYSKREITVTLPYLLAIRMVDHVASGVSRPFAGIANNLTFPEFIYNTVNFLPREIPGLNQKQGLVDANVNYINYYDGLATMETLFTNQLEYTQLSFINNVMGVQEIIKAIRTKCPSIRYTWIDGDDLEKYIEDVKEVLNNYSANYKKLDIKYMADENYEHNKIFYAMLTVQFKDFIQEEFFKIYAIS